MAELGLEDGGISSKNGAELGLEDGGISSKNGGTRIEGNRKNMRKILHIFNHKFFFTS